MTDGFDLVVNDCFAHNGANKKIQLIDHHGCPVDTKLISKFQGSWGMENSMYETVIYAHMKTFRFTGTPALYIECDIRMCHGRCPVSTQFLLGTQLFSQDLKVKISFKQLYYDAFSLIFLYMVIHKNPEYSYMNKIAHCCN